MIQISLKVDEIEDQEIAAWVKSFQGRRSRLLSLNIRKAIKFYLENSTGISSAGAYPQSHRPGNKNSDDIP